MYYPPFVTFLVLLLLIIPDTTMTLHNNFVVAGPFLKSDTVPCYSCMSKLYEAVWPSLSNIYLPPLNFTDDCNDDRIAEGRVPIVRCSTICLSLFEQPNIAGIRIKGYIRGCMNGVLKKGFNMSVVNRYRWLHRDSCRPYRKRELFELGEHQTDDSTIDVCTCYADHCNGNVSPKMFVSPLVVFVAMIFVSYRF